MIILMSIHHPHPEHRDAVIASMHRYGAAMAGEPGLISVHTLADDRSDRLVGIAMFESDEALRRCSALGMAVVGEDPFDTWERVDMDGMLLREV